MIKETFRPDLDFKTKTYWSYSQEYKYDESV